MGLTAGSTGLSAIDHGLLIEKSSPGDRVIALAGNPNVGKSTVFNALTGMNQHTGNWPGKTVTSAQGVHIRDGRHYLLVDLPGTYSLMAHSAEEEVARNFLCFGGADAVIVVCDATCLERNLNLVLQTIEITPRVVVCLNLMDEAAKKGIIPDKDALEKELGVPVVETSARSGRGLSELMAAVERVISASVSPQTVQVRYLKALEDAISLLTPAAERLSCNQLPARWLALRRLEGEEALLGQIEDYLGVSLRNDPEMAAAYLHAKELLSQAGIGDEVLHDRIVSCIVLSAESIATICLSTPCCAHASFDRKLDRVLTSRKTGIPIMLLLLCAVFWLTITGANYPSELLSRLLFWGQDRLSEFVLFLGAPDWLHGALVLGIYRVLAWVVSVMLPPMAIFFPLFTLLEDFGYLPRIAFNLDRCFQKCSACGKQALTMCIGKSVPYPHWIFPTEKAADAT